MMDVPKLTLVMLDIPTLLRPMMDVPTLVLDVGAIAK
ncbi:MAG: hypothetical protein ACI9PN_002180 [Candidatus Azotimanducaceae bacterium]|jgi:hypothetical protein